MGIEARTQISSIEIFAGDAIEAGQIHKKNANVAVALALSSGTLDVPLARLVADPQLTLNIHEITVTGPAGNMHIRIENRPMDDNPKTSYVTSASIVAAIKSLLAPIRFG
nr:aspartate dehydrogenase domain-containing protein [Mesorhizobium mediterraneum]